MDIQAADPNPETRTWLIDPYAITDFERTDGQLESFMIFAVCVAGKKATMIAPRVQSFLEHCGHTGSPIERVRGMIGAGTLEADLRRVKMGKYTLLLRFFPELAAKPHGWLRTASEADLELLHGISSKTARFFTCHSRRDAAVGVVDTHMLKFLRAAGVADVPVGNAAGPHYARLERAVHAEVAKLGMDHADFDLQVWRWYADGNKGYPKFEIKTP